MDVSLNGDLSASANTGSGGIYISESNDMSIATINAGTGNIVLTSANAILDGSVPETANIIGTTATLLATTGIGSVDDIDTQIATLDARNTGTTGNIQINELAGGGAINVNRLAQTHAGGNGKQDRKLKGACHGAPC